MLRKTERSGLTSAQALVVPILVFVLVLLLANLTWAQERTYTLDADFDEGFLVNVNHDSPNNDQLQLNFETQTLPFIWVACSARGTVVRINVNNGEILGE